MQKIPRTRRLGFAAVLSSLLGVVVCLPGIAVAQPAEPVPDAAQTIPPLDAADAGPPAQAPAAPSPPAPAETPAPRVDPGASAAQPASEPSVEAPASTAQAPSEPNLARNPETRRQAEGAVTNDRERLHAEEPSGEGNLRYELENIEVRGNSKTSARVLLRYIPFRRGDVLDVYDPRIELTRYRLLGTGFFRDVQFSLHKGSRPGRVVLLVEVVERNTIVFNDIWMGLSADADRSGEARPLTAYAGVDFAETNLAGTGITLGSAIGIAQNQLALRMRFLDPAFLGGPWMTSATLLFNDAQDFFGNERVHFVPGFLEGPQTPAFAVLQYERFGGSLGFGRDVSVSTQLWANYRLETIRASVPLAASHVRGTGGQRDVEPIDFSVLPGRSVLSTIGATLQHDTRDRPILPTRGWFATIHSEVSLQPLGSQYSYMRFDINATKWWHLPWRHVIGLQLFGGAIAGDAPFFEQYYVSDLSDFRASRLLGMNVERRPSPNFFDTAIVEVQRGEYAAKVAGEYRIPLYRGNRSVFGIDLFASAGLFAVAGRRDIQDPPGGYSGAALIPLDLTANLGFQMDTSAGGFNLAFANVLGFIPLRSGDR